MRLEKYINEIKTLWFEEDPENAIKLLKRECKYYFSLLKGKKPLYRGVLKGGPFSNQLLKKEVRKDRTPKGTKLEDFKKFNNWLENNGHSRRDKAVITTSKKSWTSTFGTPYYIFPIGRFNYTFIRAKDVNDSDRRTGWGMSDVELFFREDREEVKKIMINNFNRPEFFEKFPTYFTTNKGFDEAYKNGYEIWFDCKEYYLSRIDDEIGEYFKG